MTLDFQIEILLQELNINSHKHLKLINQFVSGDLDYDAEMILINEINAINVKIATINFKLENLKSGNPLLGYEIPEVAPLNEIIN